MDSLSPDLPPIADAELRATINDLVNGSVEAVTTLTLVVLRGQCTVPQVCQVCAALYDTLDSVQLQRAKENNTRDSSVCPLQQTMALRSLACIIPLSEDPPEQTFNEWSSHWPSIHEWIIYLKTGYVDRDSIDTAFRIHAKRAIVDFLGLSQHRPLGGVVGIMFHSQGMFSILLALWRLEVQDHRFGHDAELDDQPPSIHSTAGILDCWQANFLCSDGWDWRAILQPFEDDGAVLASTALAHLTHDMAHVPIDYDRLICDIHLMTTLSVKNTIRMSMINQGSMSTLVNLVLLLVRGEHPADAHCLVAKALSFACWYIRAYVEVTDGLQWVKQVVETGILEALLLIEPYMKYMSEPDDWEPLHLLLREIIPRYTIYRSLLKLMVKSLKEIETADLYGKIQKDTPLWDSWGAFDDEVQWKVGLLDTDADQRHIHSCQNIKCGKSGLAGTFKQCAGCLHVYYCSKECQAYDWKHGSHQSYCHNIQARRANQQEARISAHDLRFFDSVVNNDLTWYAKTIQEVAATYPDSPVAVQFDYTEVPVTPTIAPVSRMPPPPTCKCETMIHQKWTHMLELARQSTSPRILMRAFIPCGTYIKIKLQLIPLSRVTAENDRHVEDDFDNMYDQFYECAGMHPSFMDSAFPEVNREKLHGAECGEVLQ
ncbi:hypothetical protein ID866_7987 [Astraeus odoratus]|nr:hypothetical protein ID866_7987 [Astraeus odoratus]